MFIKGYSSMVERWSSKSHTWVRFLLLLLIIKFFSKKNKNFKQYFFFSKIINFRNYKQMCAFTKNNSLIKKKKPNLFNFLFLNRMIMENFFFKNFEKKNIKISYFYFFKNLKKANQRYFYNFILFYKEFYIFNQS